MRNFNIMALEERIVLDATLLGSVLNLTINQFDFADIGGNNVDSTMYAVGNAKGLGSSGGHFIDTLTGQTVGNLPSFLPNGSGGSTAISWLIVTSGMNAVQFNDVGQHLIQFDFNDPFLGPNLTVAVVNVFDNTAPDVVSTNPVSAQEATFLPQQVLATVHEANGISILSSSSDNPSLVLSNVFVAPNPAGSNLYDIVGDVLLNDYGSGQFSIQVVDPSGNFTKFSVDVEATDAPFALRSNPPILTTEGVTLNDHILGTFREGTSILDPAAFISGLTATSVDPNIVIDQSSLYIVVATPSGGGGSGGGVGGGGSSGGNAQPPYFEVRGDITFKDVVTNGVIAVHVEDIDGGPNTLEFNVLVNAVDAPLTAGPQQTVSLVEGSGIPLTPVLVATFTDANPFADVGDFTGVIEGLPVGLFSTGLLTFEKNGNDFNVYANISGALGNDAGLVAGSVIISDLNDGSSLSVPLQFNINSAPWNLGPVLSVDAQLGIPFVAKIGSFVDTNINETSYTVLVDNNITQIGDGGATGYLVSTGQGTYDVYANLQYDALGAFQGSYIIQDLTNLGTPNSSETLTGSFNANVRPNQLLWGVDENSNQLFSVGDYALAGAEGRVTLYGQLHTALGNVDGKVQAFTIDGADALGKNAAYIAISGYEDGLNNFSIGVIADINDAANRTEVTLYKISGLKFDAQRDRITGLAVDPISGNLMGVVTRSGSPDTLFVIDKNTLSSADHIAKGYTIGKIIGHDDLGGQKVTNARDLAFDENGNLFVTDGTKDKLYRISSGTGEILEVVNMNEDNGVGEANIEALAWDPILNKMVGANALLNGGNDLVGLSLENGPNSIDVHLLQSLGDIQGMAFAPEFALRAGDDLGVLIDIARSEVQYEVGDGPMLLLRNVELVSFGEDTYDGGSLTVDVSGVDVNEFFAIKAGDGIKINEAGEIRYKGLWIGTIDALNNGKNGNALTVNFTANAGERAVESLMQRITYLNTNSTLALGERVISFTIKDSLGAIIGYTTIDLQIEAEDSAHC